MSCNVLSGGLCRLLLHAGLHASTLFAACSMPTTRDRRPANTFNYGLYFNDGMAGQYFDVDVHYDVEIAGMDIYVHNASGIQTWSIYFKAGSYKGLLCMFCSRTPSIFAFSSPQSICCPAQKRLNRDSQVWRIPEKVVGGEQILHPCTHV